MTQLGHIGFPAYLVTFQVKLQREGDFDAPGELCNRPGLLNAPC